MSVVDVLRQKPMVEYIPEAIRKSDGTYRCCCPVHGGDNETSLPFLMIISFIVLLAMLVEILLTIKWKKIISHLLLQ